MSKKEDNTYAYDDDYEEDNINDDSPDKNDSDEPDERNMVGNRQMNDLVDKEVEKVTMKNNQQKQNPGYALPGDEDDDGDVLIVRK